MSLRLLSSIIVFAALLILGWRLEPARAIQGTGFYCSKTAIFDATVTSAMTRIIQGDGVNQINICGYIIGAGPSATNAGLVYGKGNNCATGTQEVTPFWQMGANDILADNSTGWRGMLVPIGFDLCVNISSVGGKPAQAMVFYEVAP